jgi:hypothetical protein
MIKQTKKHIEKRVNSRRKTIIERRKDPKYDHEFRERCGKANSKYIRKLTKDELFELYINQKLAMNKIAKKINSDACTVLNWLRRYNIPSRTLSQSQKIRKMPKIFKKTFDTLNKNTRTGSYFNHIRPLILKRDKYQCKKCGSFNYIIVHHIIPLEKGGTHDPNNLITLCRKCHIKFHKEIEST